MRISPAVALLGLPDGVRPIVAVPAASRVLAEQNFKQPFDPATGTAAITGSFPTSSALHLDSGWAIFAANFGPEADVGGEGKMALRVRVERVTSGVLMLLIPGPIPLDGKSGLRLSFLLRGGGQPVVVNLRQARPPGGKWTVLAGRTVTAANEWQRVDLRFPPTTNERGGQVEIRFARAGDYLLDDVKLLAVTRDAAAERAALAGKNLLDASSQPVGHTAPWNVSPLIGSNPNVTGPTGVPAIRFGMSGVKAAKQDVSLYASVPVEVGGTFTLTFWAKKDGPGERAVQARLYPNDANPWWTPQYSQGYKLSDQWQRITHTVDLPAAAEGFHVAQLVVDGAGPDVLVDGLMVEAGDKAGTFARVGVVELGLTDAKPLGVHFDDEPLEFAVSGWGDLAKLDHVDLTITPSDDRPMQKSVKPAGEGVASASVTLDAASLPYGQVLIEATAVDAAGKAISPVEELVVHKVRRPRAEGTALNDSAFGVHVWPGSPQEVAAAERLGFRWARLFEATEWPTAEPTKGQFDWAEPDKFLDELEAHHFGVLAILGLTPDWARTAGDFDSLGGYWAKKGLPADVAEYGRYVAAVAARYKGRIDVYEPWNEPFWARFFTRSVQDKVPVRGTPAEYAALHKAAADAIRAADPDARVAWNSGGGYDTEDAMNNDRRIAELGVLDKRYTDVLTVHDYGGVTAPAGFPGDFASTKHPLAARALARDFGRPDMPIWDSESGMPPAQPKGSWYRHAAPVGRRAVALDQAEQLVRVYVSRLAAGEDKWFLYTFAARTAYRPTYDMLAPDGHLPPFGDTLSNLFWHLEGTHFRESFAPADGLNAYGFSGDGRSVVVLLPAGGGEAYHFGKLPAGVAARDWYGNDLAAGALLNGRPGSSSPCQRTPTLQR